MTTTMTAPTIGCDAALTIARADAEKVYDNLHRFRIEVQLDADGWHVEFWLKAKLHGGGGPHYVINADTGEISSKKYYQ